MSTVLLAATPPAAPDEYDVTPGLLGFVVVFAIAIALWFLLASMIRHLRRIDVGAHERATASGAGDAAPDQTDQDADSGTDADADRARGDMRSGPGSATTSSSSSS